MGQAVATQRCCSSCGGVKPLDEFHVDPRSRAGRRGKCKACERRRASEHYAKNRPRILEAQSIRDKSRPNRSSGNPSERARRQYVRLSKDPVWRVQKSMSRGMRRSLRCGKDGQSWTKLVGYGVAELRRHLEQQFTAGMSWDNYGQWHIDHIVPLASFTITGPDDPAFARAWSLPNLRPLWASENIRKKHKRLFLL